MRYRLIQMLMVAALIAAPSVYGQRSATSKRQQRTTAAKSNFESPDFAFPLTVAKDAETVLKSTSSSPQKKIQAAIQLTAARNSISIDNVQSTAVTLDSLAAIMPVPYSQILYSLEAQLYVDYYQNNSMKLEEARTASTDESPELWDKSTFTLKVMDLVNHSLNGQGLETPLSAVSGLLSNYSTRQAEYYPTVYDLLAYRAIDLLAPFKSRETVIPFSTQAAQSQPPAQQAYNLVQNILDSLIERYSTMPKPLSRAVIAKYAETDQETAYNAYSNWQKRTDNEAGTMAFVFLMGVSIPDNESAYKEYYDFASGMLQRYPDSDYSVDIRSILNYLSVKAVNVESSGVSLLGTPLKVTSKVTNINRYYLLLFQTGDRKGENNFVNLASIKSKPIEIKEITHSGTVPFAATDTICFGTETPLAPGYYVVVASESQSISGTLGGSSNNIARIRVGSTSAFTVSGNPGEANTLYVVDAGGGKPLEGVSVDYYSCQWNKRNTLLLKNKTNRDGASQTPGEWADARIQFAGKKGSEYFSMDVSGRAQANASRGKTTNATILTDLPIYRPNDTIQFTIVAYSDSAKNLNVSSRLPLEVILYDPNHRVVGDTLRIVTDADGRAFGRLPVLSAGPTGSYGIIARSADKVLTSSYITVAEYVAPTFFVETYSINLDSTACSPINIRGKVQTYSGMPIAGANVNLLINYRQLYWWRMYNDAASYGASAVTDDNGEYTFTLDTRGLAETRFATGVFDVSVTATSPAGESQSATPTAFILGKGYRLETQLPERQVLSGKEITFTADVQDALGAPQHMEVAYTLTDTETGIVTAKGSFISPTLTLSSSKIPSGRYKLHLTLSADTTVTASGHTVLYRNDDKRVPYTGTPLWVPQSQITAEAGQKTVQIKVGSGYSDSYVLMEVGNSEGVIMERRWLRCGPSLQDIAVPVPNQNERIWVVFHAMHNFVPESQTVAISPSSASNKLNIKVVSFRDKLIPGSEETWEFTLLNTGDNHGPAANAPAIAVMTNQALNALVNFKWDFSPRRGLWWRNPLRSNNYSYMDYFASFSSRVKSGRGFSIERPRINLYNVPLSGRLYYQVYYASPKKNAIRVRGTHKMEATSDEAENEMVVFDAQTEAAPTASAKVMSAGAVEEVNVVEEDGGSIARSDIRDAEHPLAFFKPALCSDADGNLKISFTTPNFNTGWQFQLLAYNHELYAASTLLTAISSKPVMVQTTTPRFLRTGDRPVVTATAFNNTDSTASVGGYIEIFDPTSGSILQRNRYDMDALAAKGSRVFSIDIITPDTVQLLGVRAVATSGNYSDGEQTIIGVVPSSTPVIDAIPFYLAPDDTSYSLKLPEFNDKGTVTLQFTNNPVWYCVTALPEISVPASDCLTSLLYAQFGNELAASLVKRNPEIWQAINIWSATGSSALTSPLLKDGNLKSIALQQTVWVRNADSETMRMLALNELLDPTKSAQASKTLTEKISSLQTSDGGWSWMPGMQPSLYMTTRVLSTFARLKALGVTLSKDIDAMLAKGIRYADKEIYAVYQQSLKHKSGFPTGMMLNYFAMRGEFSTPLSTNMSSLKRLTFSHVAKEWRTMEVGAQATAAIFLHAGGRTADAMIILESLRQRASSSPEKGMWFDNMRGINSGDGPLLTTARVLEAFAAIAPQAPEIDMLRQWLVIQRQTQDWGDNRMVAEVISAILTTGSEWTNTGKETSITIGGEKISPDEVEAMTGSYTMVLGAKEASGAELTVSTTGGSPAWGGVIQQYIAPITQVQASAVPDLTIDKQVYVVETTAEGEKLRLVDDATLCVGQKVRISLTLTAGRDLDYVAVTDSRSACLQPVDQLSGYQRQGNTWYYLEPRNEVTNLFIDTLTKGAHVLTYDCYVQQGGLFSLGIATVQSQYSPAVVAHSAGIELKVIERQ